MPQNFDVQEYTEKLEDFIQKIQDSRFVEKKESDNVFHDICSVLGVSKIIMHKTPHNINHHNLHGDLDAVYDDSGDFD